MRGNSTVTGQLVKLSKKKKKKTEEKDVQINEHEYYYGITTGDFTQQFFFFTLTAELHTSIIKEPLVTFYKTPHGYLYTSNKV